MCVSYTWMIHLEYPSRKRTFRVCLCRYRYFQVNTRILPLWLLLRFYQYKVIFVISLIQSLRFVVHQNYTIRPLKP